MTETHLHDALTWQAGTRYVLLLYPVGFTRLASARDAATKLEQDLFFSTQPLSYFSNTTSFLTWM